MGPAPQPHISAGSWVSRARTPCHPIRPSVLLSNQLHGPVPMWQGGSTGPSWHRWGLRSGGRRPPATGNCWGCACLASSKAARGATEHLLLELWLGRKAQQQPSAKMGPEALGQVLLWNGPSQSKKRNENQTGNKRYRK